MPGVTPPPNHTATLKNPVDKLISMLSIAFTLVCDEPKKSGDT
jgi:hypothetical protein